ncbi:hypothetical protein ACOSQ4_009019 [Xanthoceras sorbifolium]
MHIAEKGEADVQVILFLHGFPELWYSWRHQMLALSSIGYRAIAPDLQGYGDTEAPGSITSYTCLHIVGDQVPLMDSWCRADDYYMCRFQKPGKIEAEIDRCSAKEVLKRMLTSRKPGPPCWATENPFGLHPVTLPAWFSKEDLDYYAAKFNKSGFTGAAWTGAVVKTPVKYVEYVDNGDFKKDVPLLEEIVGMEDVGHFINQERAEQVNTLIYDSINKF